MDVYAILAQAGTTLQIVLIDLLLSADNALLIALAVRALPPAEMRRAIVAGTTGAILFRIAMASVVVFVLQIPYLQIAAAAVLVVIAIKLTIEQTDPALLAPEAAPPATSHAGVRLLAAILTIMVADAIMSLDNVVAIAAVAQGSLALLAFGLLLSIPLLVWGSSVVITFLDENPALVALSGMALGWIAGRIAVGDPAIAGWIARDAPALAVVLPIACALLVLWEGRILRPRAPQRHPETGRT